jgi:hypothetical protein
MLEIKVEPTTLWDPEKERFYDFNGEVLLLEHSLLSISKWEAKWHKPLLEESDMNEDELLDYIRCMTINKHVDPYAYKCLTPEQQMAINDYIGDQHTATWFAKSDDNGHGEKRVLTAELVYYYMFSFGIPKDCEKWHFNRLLTLLRVFSEENKPKKKQTPEQLASHHRALNRARRARHKKPRKH